MPEFQDFSQPTAMIKKASCQHQWKSSSGLLKKTRQNSIPVSLKVSYTTASITPYRLTTKHDLRLCLLGFLLYKHETNILKNPDFVRVFFFSFSKWTLTALQGRNSTHSLPLPTTCWLNSARKRAATQTTTVCSNYSLQAAQPCSCMKHGASSRALQFTPSTIEYIYPGRHSDASPMAVSVRKVMKTQGLTPKNKAFGSLHSKTSI